MAHLDFLPKEYGYVVLDLVLYSLLNFWMAIQVGQARRKYKVFYPTMYAVEAENKDAKLFNCIQRGHQNSLEMMPVFFVNLLVGGLKHPLIAAVLGGIYVISRFFYFKGYSTGDPNNRYGGFALSFPSIIGLIICSGSLAVHLIKAAL